MVGYIQTAIVGALRAWEPLRTANVMAVRAVEGQSVVVNTTLPAIAVHVIGTEGHGNTYLGGGIRQYFYVQLHFIVEVPNYSFTPDKGRQAESLDLSDEVIRCLELSDVLTETKVKHDWNMQFDRMETETTYGTNGSQAVTLDVHKIIYDCDVRFDVRLDRASESVKLKRVEIDNNGINQSIVT